MKVGQDHVVVRYHQVLIGHDINNLMMADDIMVPPNYIFATFKLRLSLACDIVNSRLETM